MYFSPERRIPVVIVGLEDAGKTTLSLRLQTGGFKHTMPTAGLDTEILELDGTLFQLFDLGGHERFRHLLWKKHVQYSQGIIYVIDSSAEASEKLDPSIEWLWKCLKWNLEAPLLILANKSDLTHVPLDLIVSKIRLNHLHVLNPSRSFQIFEISCLTGHNISRAVEWFFQKIAQIVPNQQIRITGVYLYLPTGVPIETLNFSNREKSGLDIDMVPGFLNALETFLQDVMGDERLHSISTDRHQILMVKHDSLLCAIVTDKDSSPAVTRMVAESLIKHIENRYAEQLGRFKKEGIFQFPKGFILDYLNQNFAENIRYG
ncbi:MAG: ADP-ribosylation factor-like protein [Candidatus Heimdallarchaeota archaeon]